MDDFWVLKDFEKEFPSFRLDAVPHAKTAFASELFSKYQIEQYLYIRVPVYIAREYELKYVDEIKDRAIPLEPDSEGIPLWEHDSRRIWYRFLSRMLDMETGYHNYRLTFRNKTTHDTCLLYFAYTIQNNDPEKPYIYMKHHFYPEGSSEDLGRLAYEDYATGTLDDYAVGVESTFVGEGISTDAHYIPQGNISDVELSKKTVSSITGVGTLPNCVLPTIDIVDDKIIISSGSFDPGTLPTFEETEVADDVSKQPTFEGSEETIHIEGVPTGTITNTMITTEKEVIVE